ncbi:TIGR03757 family integrating conjugative element protein [Saezia sanguinis]|uniref:TIGR03757 family integrating conjugative element protein n=1 Tax=Saezia sanguinis TaxID=1965230 RepID=UPI00304EF216
MHKYIVSCIAALALLASFGVNAQQILVFTDTQHPVFSVPDQTHVYELDQVGQIEESLFDGLDTHKSDPAELVKARLTPQTHHQLAQAYQGIVDAWTLGIQKIPAVVVDRQYVIYGEPDVGKAISRIQIYQEKHQ